MNHEVFVSGSRSSFLDDKILSYLKLAKPKALGIASAFVSVAGIEKLEKMVSQCGVSKCKIVAGLDNAITHPAALQRALDNGWDLRLSPKTQGIFHPKLVVAGSAFSANGTLRNIGFLYIGSSNLTMGGLRKNVECGLLSNTDAIPATATTAFSQLWEMSTPATKSAIRNYGALFAERARRRSVVELVDLGVNDEYLPTKDLRQLRASASPAASALSTEFAVAAWAGLQSYTGDYRFQIEFPRNAGKVISQLIGSKKDTTGHVDVYCIEDGITRRMQYGFYRDNGMFRLNVPNDVPGVDWARANRDGIAIVERGLPGGAAIGIKLLRPGPEANEIANRSVLLGTWGKTPTRAYGWY